MKIFFPFLFFTALVLPGCSGGSSNNSSTSTNSASANSFSNAVGAPVNYLGAIMQAEKYSENKIDVTSLNQAIQQFNASEGHYPKDLQELVPDYIAKVPQAPPGYKINYDLNSGAVTVVKQ